MEISVPSNNLFRDPIENTDLLERRFSDLTFSHPYCFSISFNFDSFRLIKHAQIFPVSSLLGQ